MKSIALFLSLIFVTSTQILGQTNPEPTNKFILSKEASKDDYAANVVIVKFKTLNPEGKISMESTEIENLKQHMKLATIQQVRQLFPPTKRNPKDNQFGLMRIVEIKYKSAVDIEQVINEILKNEAIEYAEPSYNNRCQHAGDVSSAVTNTVATHPVNDPGFVKGWQSYLEQVHAPEAWGLPLKSTGAVTPVIIAVIDSGLDFDHEDLAGNIYYNEADPVDGIDNDEDGYIDNYRGWDFADNDHDPRIVKGEYDHGTHVSGLASAVMNNEKGIASIANNYAKLLILKGYYYEAIKYAADHGANIINCSWGSTFFSAYNQEVVNYAINQGCLIVASAGNEAQENNATSYPAAYPNVFAVSSVDPSDKKSDFSNYGRYVSISAPGNNIYSTGYGNGYSLMYGTSTSSPLVASAAALVKAHFPLLTMLEVGNRLKHYADPIDNLNPMHKGQLGAGRLNVYRALTEEGAPNVFVESNSPVLPGALLAISASLIQEDATYYWETPDGLTKTTKVPYLERSEAQPNMSGAYKLIVKMSSLGEVTEYPPAFVDVTVLDYSITPTVESNAPMHKPIYMGEMLTLLSITAIKGASYHWVSPDGLSVTTEDPYVIVSSVSGALSGTHTLTISVNGYTFPTASIDVGIINSSIPMKLDSNSPLCVGNTLNLFIPTPITAIKDYRWELPDGSIVVTSVPRLERDHVIEAMEGTYTVTISADDHIYPPISTIVEIIDSHQPITVQSNSPVCPGDQMSLWVNPVEGAISYHWEFPNGLVEITDWPYLDLPHADMTMSGSYTLTVLTAGCIPPPPASCTVMIDDVQAKELIVGSNSPVCPGDQIFLWTTPITGAISYHWQFPNGLSETTDSPCLDLPHADMTMSGTYTLTVSTVDCMPPSPTSIDVEVRSPILNRERRNADVSQVRDSFYMGLKNPYPNPAQSYMHIPFTIPRAGHVSIKIYRLVNGFLVKEIKQYYSQGGDYSIQADLSDFKYDDRSLYFYRLEYDHILHPVAKQFSVSLL